jgi:PAS domain-containing protein
MSASKPRTRKTPNPGLRALAACGDGFWEFDLLDSSAWFSDWFYRKLHWSADAKRTTLLDLQPLLQPDAWDEMMRSFRAHFEQNLPLDLKLRVQVSPDQTELWHMRGSAQRNPAGQPVHLAGSMREVSADAAHPETSSRLLRLRDAFEALPVAAALLDAESAVLEMNRLWRELPAGDADEVLTRLQAAGVQSAVEFLVDHGADAADPHRLRVRAVPFHHEGSRHVVVTLAAR